MAQNTINIPKEKNGDTVREDWTKPRQKQSKKTSNPVALFSTVWASVSNGLNSPVLATFHAFLFLLTFTHYEQLGLHKVVYLNIFGLKMKTQYVVK